MYQRIHLIQYNYQIKNFMNKIILPSKLTENSWFYKEERYREQLKPHLEKYYISYSSYESWINYREDFIKRKFVGLDLPFGIYADAGSFLGEAVETGEFGDNPHGFVGLENVDLEKIRKPNAEYEKLIVIDRGDYIIIGFIDIYWETEGKANIVDLKTVSNSSVSKYKKSGYLQIPLYTYAEEQNGKEIGQTYVHAVWRTGSHLNLPIGFSKKQEMIPVKYDEDVALIATIKVDKVVKEISDCYKTYLKVFEK